MNRRRVAPAVTIAISALVLLWLVLALRLEGFVNRVTEVALPEISDSAQALHATSFVADLHADSLLFERNLLDRSDLGHVDLPRLAQGGVGLQVFAVPTIVPLGTNIERTSADGLDMITLLGVSQLSKMAWLRPTDRALHRAHQLTEFARDSKETLRMIHHRDDLERLLSARAAGAEITGALLAIEGAHALESEPAHLRTLFDAGYRMIGLSHFFDNDYAGSAHGEVQGGLSELGRATLREMESLGIVIDVAHMSPAALEETLALATKPTVFSHGGVKGTCDNPRNLSDEQIRGIAAGGGVVGIGHWAIAVCGTQPADTARAIAYVVQLVGEDHAALGSDYDGGTTVGFDTSHLASVTQALFDAGLSERAIRKVLGDNVLRVLTETLPAGGSEIPEAPANSRSSPEPNS